MQKFEIGSLLGDRAGNGPEYGEFLREEALSAGIYLLPAGSADPQQPHTEDEVYYVLEGRGWIQVGDEEQSVAPGTLIYVPAKVEHRFHTIAERLAVLVLFGPAEYTRAGMHP